MDHTPDEYQAALARVEAASARLGSLAGLADALARLDAAGHSCPDCQPSSDERAPHTGDEGPPPGPEGD